MTGTALALAAALIAHSAIAATPAKSVPDDSDAASEILQAQPDADDRMTIGVAIHGQGPYQFLIDTGSQNTVLSTALASALGLRIGPSAKVISLAGVGQANTARVESLDVGGRTFHDLTVPLLQDRHIGADGILGTDSLQHQRVVLDFDRNTIQIGDPHDFDRGGSYEITVRARKRSGQLIMTQATIDGIRTSVVIDTGSSSTIGNRALQRAMRERKGGSGVLTSVTGQTLPIDFGLAQKLKLESLEVANVLIAFADAPAFEALHLEKRPAIFLGMRELRAFRRVAIDFTTRKILFDLPG